MADIIVTLIQGGADVGPKFVPDLRMGQHWGHCWKEKSIADQFVERLQYMHNYPDSFPQAASNPQTPWAYPDAALPYFRKWVRSVYIKEKLPDFLNSKVKQSQLPPSFSQLAIKALTEKTGGAKLIDGN